jgi:hypothetical protein
MNLRYLNRTNYLLRYLQETETYLHYISGHFILHFFFCNKFNMDLINKGVQLIRRSTLTKHRRNTSQDLNTSSPPSPTISKTPSITSSITSDEGSCYSGGFHNLMTPGQTPRRNSAANPPASITITPMMSSPPQSPVNKNSFKGINDSSSLLKLHTNFSY